MDMKPHYEKLELSEFSRLDKSIHQEISEAKSRTAQSVLYRHVLDDLYRLVNDGTKRKRALWDCLEKHGFGSSPVTFESLKAAYWDIQPRLRLKNIKPTSDGRKPSEKKCEELIDKYFHRNAYFNIWIGGGEFDAFIPSYQHENSVGLILEDNGPIHRNEPKQKMDNFKNKIAEGLGITLKEFDDSFIYNPRFLKIIQELNQIKIPSSRRVKNLWRKIYIVTLACHPTGDILKKHFGLTIPMIDELVKASGRKFFQKK